ncbi:hypothetical protein ACIHDR_26030 [Nocardia sp. NPDC052278]|uniref:hypothetical protein n=1 Tax=unclassified Nocardia TaxID=2637762 RepID=UPI0036C63F62
MGLLVVASGPYESLLCELGADQFIDDTKSRPEEIVYEVGLVLDAVGSRFLSYARRCLCPAFFGD